LEALTLVALIPQGQSEAFAGNRMEMLAFSKFVLFRVGDYFVFVDLHLVISTQ
jgi:hypothetical protein